MNETRNDSGQNCDRMLFGTDDPELIKEMFRLAYEEQMRTEQTFGGYLKALRQRREYRVREAASEVGVTTAQWNHWEADHQMPTIEELTKIIDAFQFGEKKQKRLWKLRGENPRYHLLNLSRLRMENLAAKGDSRLDIKSYWSSLPEKVKELLLEWGAGRGRAIPKELDEVLGRFESDEERERWVGDVLGSQEH